MAQTNKERVGRVLDLVAEGLGPWMTSLLQAKYGDGWADEVVRSAGPTNRDTRVNVADPAYLFWVFDKQWHGLFREHLSFEDKRAVSALWDARKEWLSIYRGISTSPPPSTAGGELCRLPRKGRRI